MSDKSAIEWTDATWNPLRQFGPGDRWMCQKVSPGCDYCYASRLNVRFGGSEYGRVGDRWPGLAMLVDQVLKLPLHWSRPRRVFVCSMTDLFGEWVDEAWVRRVFDVMLAAPQHSYQVLTKRPRRMAEHLGRTWWTALPEQGRAHIWLGTTIELDRYTWRADYLRSIPAAVRFVSAEPLLDGLPNLNLDGIRWLIAGGESGGPVERRLDATSDQSLAWVRSLRDRAIANETAFFFKQWGGSTAKSGGRLLDGRTWDEYPTAREAVPA